MCEHNSNCHNPIVKNPIMDIWKYKTQGANYEKYRPQYPSELKEDALNPLPKREKYLDIAVGTGKILLSFCPFFEQTKGIDISQQMLSVSQGKVDQFKEKRPDAKINLFKKSINQITEEEKYDLITVGQALHFFTSQASFRKIKNMLNDGGMFMVFGYVLREVHGQNPEENNYFYKFYNQMLPYFTFDMYELHRHYTDEARYPFSKVFDKMDRKQADIVVKMTRQQYISYLKTWSAYNLYMEKMGVDPIAELQQAAGENVTCVFDYFRIRCYK